MNSVLSSSQISQKLKQGMVGILPTDTVYGLVCRASNKEAVSKFYELKKRENKLGTIIAASIDQLVELGLKRSYLKAVEHYWPNPVSIIIPCGRELEHLHKGKMSLAVRIPQNAILSQIISKTGALLTTSANLPKQPVATNLRQAKQYFGNKVDFYVAGGDLSDRKASSVIEVIDDMVEVHRQGEVKINEDGSVAQ